MPQYQKAKPFDIINTIKSMQAVIKQLQVRVPGSTGPWQAVTYQNSWAGISGDGLIYRLTMERCVHIVGRATTPAGYTNGQIAALVSYGTANRTEYCPAVFYNVSTSESACLLSLSTTGQLGVFGGLASGNTLIVNAMFPLDGLAVP